VLDLFAECLADVRFPDVDFALLESTAQALGAAELAVERAVTVLQSARATAEAQLVLMTSRAERALAYARVFAGDDSALAARIAQVGGKTSAPVPTSDPRKRRGRPRKSDADASLFSAPCAATQEAVTSA
jgi:hypothetical protein